jgi:hypothetical protein
MKLLRFCTLFAIVLAPAALVPAARAQISVGIGIGAPGYGYGYDTVMATTRRRSAPTATTAMLPTPARLTVTTDPPISTRASLLVPGPGWEAATDGEAITATAATATAEITATAEAGAAIGTVTAKAGTAMVTDGAADMGAGATAADAKGIGAMDVAALTITVLAVRPIAAARADSAVMEANFTEGTVSAAMGVVSTARVEHSTAVEVRGSTAVVAEASTGAEVMGAEVTRAVADTAADTANQL